MNSWAAYTLSTLIVALTALSGSIFTARAVKTDWYKCVKPSITPPNAVFPVVWTTLYIMLAIALGRFLQLQLWSTSTLLLASLALTLRHGNNGTPVKVFH